MPEQVGHHSLLVPLDKLVLLQKKNINQHTQNQEQQLVINQLDQHKLEHNDQVRLLIQDHKHPGVHTLDR